MKKIKIFFIVVGLMLSILLLVPKIELSWGSSLQLPMAKQFPYPASPSRCWRLHDQRYRGNYPPRYFHSIDNRGSPFYLPHSEMEKLLFPYLVPGDPFSITEWLPIFDNFHQKNPIPEPTLPRYPYFPAGVRAEWARTYESRSLPAWDSATDLAVDSEGNVYVTGYSTNMPQGMDYYTIKYDMNGNQVWARYFNGETDGDDIAWKIALDGVGNVYVGGTSSGMATGFDFIVVKYNRQG